MHFFFSRLRYILYFLCFSYFLLGTTQVVLAASLPNINITQNNQVLFSGKIALALKKLQKEAGLEILLESNENISLLTHTNTYQVWVAPGIYSATGSLSFRLAGRVHTLPINISIAEKSLTDFSIFSDMYHLHLQEKSLSCESAASADILATLIGKKVLETEVISLLPKSNFYNKLPEKIGSQTLWGNPQEGFVGYIDHSGSIIAKQKLMTGYGVYEKPIAQLYQSFGLTTQILTQELHSKDFTKEQHLSYLLQKLSLGDMVQLWGDWCTKIEFDDGAVGFKNTCYNVDESRTLTWQYTDASGKLQTHTGLDGEHAFILLGWKGDISLPSHIRVWDTDTGYHSYPLQEWMRKWGKMQYRSIVIEKP